MVRIAEVLIELRLQEVACVHLPCILFVFTIEVETGELVFDVLAGSAVYPREASKGRLVGLAVNPSRIIALRHANLALDHG
jgi:hypothetical protein